MIYCLHTCAAHPKQRHHQKRTRRFALKLSNPPLTNKDSVTPANAGVQRRFFHQSPWIPAFAGMTAVLNQFAKDYAVDE